MEKKEEIILSGTPHTSAVHQNNGLNLKIFVIISMF
jgi:hypothetical protein